MKKKIVASLIALSVLFAGTACAYGEGTITTPECIANAAGPNDTTGGSGLQTAKAKGNLLNSVVGMVWTSCSPAPLEHNMTVEIWFEPTGSVENMHMIVRYQFARIPRAIPEPNTVHYDPCIPGTYQLQYYIVGRTSQNELFVTPHMKGYEKTFTAQDCGMLPYH